MAWIKLDDHFDQHPKLVKAGPLGLALWVAGLAYCNRNLTDGRIPWGAARSLMAWEFLEPSDDGRQLICTVDIGNGMRGEQASSDRVISLLVSAGLWDETPDGYLVHDYLDFQPSKTEVLEDRKQGAQRQQNWRYRRRNAVTNGHSNGVTNGPVTDAPYPVSVENLESKHLSADADDSPTNGHPNGTGTARRKAKPEAEPESFAAFYAAVPRRIGRRAAAKSFASALRRHPDLEPQDLVNAAGQYSRRVRSEGLEDRFVPHPATWLNQDRFLEEFADDQTTEG